MKRQILISLISVTSILTMNAQQWNGTNTVSKVGIGITTTPSGQLDVWSPASNGTITRFATLLDNGQAFDLKAIQTSTGHGYFSLDNSSSTTGWQNIAIPTGSVSIGTTTSSGQLDVWRPASNGIITRFATLLDNGQAFDLKAIQTSTGHGYFSLDNSSSTTGWQNIAIPTGSVSIGTTTSSGQLDVWRPASNGTITRFATFFDDGQAIDLKATQTSTGNGYFSFDFSTNTGWQKLVIPTGSVGIGTTSPDSRFKLDVEGTIRASEVKVCLQGGCDFVFKSNYKLMDINRLEEFVKTNQHLPEIAPEIEMIENGVNMKELQMKLLQKIEELTLYTIEQNKKLVLQQQQIVKQNEKIEKLEKKIEKIGSASK
jgi:hypothetical protein